MYYNYFLYFSKYFRIEKKMYFIEYFGIENIFVVSVVFWRKKNKNVVFLYFYLI